MRWRPSFVEPCTLALCLFFFGNHALARQTPAVESTMASVPRSVDPKAGDVDLRVTTGFGLIYMDEGPFPAKGGSVRVFLNEKVGLEAEVLHLRKEYLVYCAGTGCVPGDQHAYNFNHELRLLKVSWMIGPGAYVFGGPGVVKLGDDAGGGTRPAWSGGIGWRLFPINRLFVASEVAGGTAWFRFTIGVGYSIRIR